MKYIEVRTNAGDVYVVMFNTLQEAFNNLKEWMQEMERELGVDFEHNLINKATTVQELAEIAEYFYWGENDMKIYHLIVLNDDGTQKEQLI